MAFNLVWHANKVTILLLLLGELQSYSYANIVSLPRELYVLEGDRGTIRCQNRSVDEQTFYSYVSNAIWWRNETNDTITRIGESGSVYSSGHTLNFNPILSENQGNYYCCLPNQSSCSNISVIRQSTPPSIRAFNSNHTAVVGSQVTMECIITALGMPTATFGWYKNGYEISHNTIISNSSFALTMKNVTMEDKGVYNCIARNVLTYRYDRIELTVTQSIIEEHTDNFNETSSELTIIRVLAENIKTTCQIFQISVPVELKSYIREQYDHNVTVNIIEFLCDHDDKSVAICDLHFVGLSAKIALQLFITDLGNSSEGIDFNICRLRLHNQNCSGSNLTSENDDAAIDHNNINDAAQLSFVILLVMIIMFVILSVLPTTPSSHNANSNTIFQMEANGYALPDDFGKQSLNVFATRSNLTSETQTQLKVADKRNKASHKTAVILKSDGTGIIQTGTLQVLIPSSRSDENYAVTPSLTHQS